MGMGRIVSIQNIMDAVRARGEWRASWLPNNTLLSYINDSMAALHDAIIAIDPYDSSLLKMGVVAVSAGTQKYSWPSDLFQVVGVAVKDGTKPDGYAVLEQGRWASRYADSYGDVGSKAETRWIQFGSSFLLSPRPNWSGELRVEYIRSFPPASSSSETFDVENAWHEFVVLDCCVKCAAAEESDPQPYMVQQQAVLARMRAASMRAAEMADQEISSSSAGTLASIRRAVRGRGKFPLNDISQENLTEFVNSSARAFEDLVIGLAPARSPWLKRGDISVVAGTSKYALPSDLRVLHGVSVADGSQPDGYAVLERFRFDERSADSYWDAGVKSAVRWERFGPNLILQPKPNWNGTIRLEYTRAMPVLVYPTDALGIEDGWVEWIVLDSAVKCAVATGADPSALLAQQKLVSDRIAAALKAEEMSQILPVSASGTTTLASLRRAVRARCGVQADAATDTSLTGWLNASIRQLADIMFMADPRLFDTRKDISVVSGTKAYALPADLYRLTGVAVRDDRKVDGYSVLLRAEWDERHDGVLGITEKECTRYLLVGSTIEFEPIPTWSDTVRLSYLAYPTALSAPTDTYSFRNGYEEWVILDCCAKASAAAGKDPSPWIAMRDDFERRINRNIVRDAAKPRVVVDQGRRWLGSRWNRGWPRW
jgi:hypothetical protein